MRQIKLYFTKRGGHYHCNVFTGEHNQTFARCGQLVFDEKDWSEIKHMFAHRTIFIEQPDKE